MSKTRFSFRLSSDLIDCVDQLASERGDSRTAFIEQALASHLGKIETRDDDCDHVFEELSQRDGYLICMMCDLVVPTTDAN